MEMLYVIVILFLISVVYFVKTNRIKRNKLSFKEKIKPFLTYLSILILFSIVSLFIFEFCGSGNTFIETDGSGFIPTSIYKANGLYVSIGFIIYTVLFIIIWFFIKKSLKKMLNCEKNYFFYISIILFVIFTIIQSFVSAFSICQDFLFSTVIMPNKFFDIFYLIITFFPPLCFIIDTFIYLLIDKKRK